MKFRRTDLGPLEKIAAGGFGCVYKAPRFQLKGDPSPMAYKEFTSHVAEQGARAREVISLWKDLDAQDRADLAEHAAWPRELVHDASGSVCGLLMPLLGDDYFCRQPDPQTGTLRLLPRAMKWLISTNAQRSAACVDVPDVELVDRDVLLAKLAYVLGRLHRHGWVYGDLSFANVAFALEPGPRIQLLDCDGAAPLSDCARSQEHTPYWTPPECKPPIDQRLQDERTDVYKLGLMILRCLTPGPGAATSEDPTRLRGVRNWNARVKATEALSHEPYRRPSAQDIYVEFLDLLDGRTARPDIKYAQLVTPFRLRGQDVSVEWEVENATKLVVEATNGQRIEVDPSAHTHGIWFILSASDTIELIV